MIRFYTPWRRQKTEGFFRGYRNGYFEWNIFFSVYPNFFVHPGPVIEYGLPYFKKYLAQDQFLLSFKLPFTGKMC